MPTRRDGALTSAFRGLLLVGLLLAAPGGAPATGQEGDPAAAAAWPQWGGATRNFHVDSVALARVWPETGPPVRWRRPLGEGYSAIVADGGTLVTMYRDGDREVVVALDAATGATRWAHGYDAPLLRNGYFDVWLSSAGPGPYATPLIAGGVVFAVGVNGQLHALDLATGAVRWSQSLVDRFDLTDYNAFASSPLAYGATIILPLGGSAEGVVALDRETGAVAWRSDPLRLAPGSPLLIDVDGEPQLVVWGQQEVVGLSPDGGRRLWGTPHPADLGLHISTPVWGGDNRLFFSSAYDGGSRAVRLGRDTAGTTVTEIWSTNRMRLHFGNAIRVGDLVIGSSGDFGPAFLTALDIATGAEVWRERSFARAQMVYADGLLVLVDEDGEVAVASVTPRGLDVHARHPLLTENAWTPPTLVGGTLYVRDRREVVALALGR